MPRAMREPRVDEQERVDRLDNMGDFARRLVDDIYPAVSAYAAEMGDHLADIEGDPVSYPISRRDLETLWDLHAYMYSVLNLLEPAQAAMRRVVDKGSKQLRRELRQPLRAEG